MTQTTPAPHRAEIDGLRAIAVSAVVLYHFGLPGLAGGFVGVDIFFVISGFLIGGILWREKTATGRLSLGRFYLRRIRRLAPAYVAMSAAVLIVGWLVLLPYDFRETAKGVIAATVYLSNVLFFRQSGYFDTAAEDKVLLHTWSLSVEEQFYLFLPLVFLLFSRSRRGMILAFAALFLASLLSAIPLTSRAHTAVFYLFPFRAWELLAGVLLAVWGQERGTDWRFGTWPSWLGLALVLSGIALIQPGPGFPGWQAMVPVAGTVLLLMNGRDPNPVNRALSMRAPVMIGLISYSLYLWHWPVLTLSTYVRGEYSGPLETSGWITLCLILSWLSWRLIEQPVRRASNLSGKTLLGGAALASVLLLGASAAIFRADGMPGRFAPETQVHIAASGDFLQDFSRCTTPENGPLKGIETCPIGPKNQTPTLLIWGDSHVRALYEGLAQAARDNNRAALVIWRAGCPPAFDLEKQENSATATQNAACRSGNDQIKAALAGMPDLRDVLLIGRWAYYATGTGSGIDAHNTITLKGDGADKPQDALLAEALAATVQTLSLQDRTVFLLRQPPEIPHHAAPEMARALAHGRVTAQEAQRMGQVTMDAAEERAASAEAAIAQSGAQILDPWPFLCDQFLCDAIQNGRGFYFDNNHLTNTAARQIRAVFAPVFAGGGT